MVAEQDRNIADRCWRGSVGGWLTIGVMLALLLLLILQTPPAAPVTPADSTTPLAPLMVYNGTWTVHTLHPFGDGPPGVDEKLESHCTYGKWLVSCEQVINGKSVE